MLYFVYEFGSLFAELEKWLSQNEVALGLDTTEEHNKREISVVGRCGCGLSINMKCAGKGTSAVKNCGYLPACSAVVMLKFEARSVCTRTRDCSSARATNKSKNIHC